MIFFDKFEKRISYWKDFREELETTNDPLNDVIRFWNKAPISARTCDPYDKETWPEAWQLIEENKYCEFGKILGIYYTIYNTDRYQNAIYKIILGQDRKEQKLYYLLIVDDIVIGYYYDKTVHISDLPKSLEFQQVFDMDV
jgi:hypothetical protein